MRIKDAVLSKFEQGWTIYDIAEEYDTTVEAIMQLLDIQEDVFSYELH